MIGSNYQLALLDIKENNFRAAKDKLILVAKNNDRLHIVRCAKKILERIDNYIV